MPHWSSNRAEHILLVVLLVEANSIFFIQKEWREFSHSYSLKPFWGRWSIFFLWQIDGFFLYIFCRKYWQTSDSPCASSWSLYFGLLQRSVLQLFLDGWRARITAHLLHQMVQRKRRVFSVSVPMTSETQMPCPEDANPSYNYCGGRIQLGCCCNGCTTISMLLGPRFTLYIPQICPNEQRDMTLELKLNTHLPSMIPKADAHILV